MSYCTGKHIENARGRALKMLLLEHYPVQVVANKFGVHRSTIWRWHQRWLELNKERQLTNVNRQKDRISRDRLIRCKWSIPTLSAEPLHPHRLPEEIVQLVLDVRDQLKRCAEVVWHYINHTLCIKVSLSSVRRILKRYGRLKQPRYRKNRLYKGLRRPQVLMPGDLVEIDTIHLYNPISKAKRYVYTVIDLYTRMAYARIYEELRPKYAVATILEAEQYFGFKLKMVQSDNGAEFSRYFAQKLISKGMKIRHTRLGRPNDNAHIERFNRTLQEECTGSYTLDSVPLRQIDNQILTFIDFYNYRRVHLGLEYRTPSQMLHR